MVLHCRWSYRKGHFPHKKSQFWIKSSGLIILIINGGLKIKRCIIAGPLYSKMYHKNINLYQENILASSAAIGLQRSGSGWVINCNHVPFDWG